MSARRRVALRFGGEPVSELRGHPQVAVDHEHRSLPPLRRLDERRLETAVPADDDVTSGELAHDLGAVAPLPLLAELAPQDRLETPRGRERRDGLDAPRERARVDLFDGQRGESFDELLCLPPAALVER